MGGSYQAGQLGRSKKRCACAGCLTMLYRGSRTFDLGFCDAHAGMAPVRVGLAGAKLVRVHVVKIVTTTTGEILRMPISLPREPWLAGGVA